MPPAPTPARRRPAPPPKRMTLTEQADFDAWMVKTYLGCWKPAAQPADADAYVAQVRLAFKPDGSLAKSRRSSSIRPRIRRSKPQAKSVMLAVHGVQPAAGAGPISPLL